MHTASSITKTVLKVHIFSLSYCSIWCHIVHITIHKITGVGTIFQCDQFSYNARLCNVNIEAFVVSVLCRNGEEQVVHQGPPSHLYAGSSQQHILSSTYLWCNFAILGTSPKLNFSIITNLTYLRIPVAPPYTLYNTHMHIVPVLVISLSKFCRNYCN